MVQTRSRGRARGCAVQPRLLLDNGNGVTVDKREAFKWYTRAAEAGHAPAQFNLGVYYLNGNGVKVDKHEAVKWYTRAAEAGHVIAQYYLGICYLKGDGIAIDRNEGIKWITRAAEAGDADAQAIVDSFKDNEALD